MKTYKEFMSEALSYGKIKSLARKIVKSTPKLKDTSKDTQKSIAVGSRIRLPDPHRVVKNILHNTFKRPNVGAASNRLAKRVAKKLIKKVGL